MMSKEENKLNDGDDFTRAVLFTVAELRELFGELKEDVVIVENGGEASVDDLGRHGPIGQQQARAKVFVLARLCKEEEKKR